MVNGPNGTSRKGTKYSHLTIAPKNQMVRAQGHLPRSIINKNNMPRAFLVFQELSFTTCDRLLHQGMKPYLDKAVRLYQEKVWDNPNFLKSFADNARMGGVTKMEFRFEAREQERAVYLTLTGTHKNTPPIETDILLLSLDL